MTMSTDSASSFSPLSIKGLWTMTIGSYTNRRAHVLLISVIFLVLPNVVGLFISNTYAFKVSDKIKLVSPDLNANEFVTALLSTFSSELWPMVLAELTTALAGLFGCVAIAVTFRNYFRSSPLGLGVVLKDALAISWSRGIMTVAALIVFAIPTSLFSILRIFFACLILMVPVLLVHRQESGFKTVLDALFLRFAKDSGVNRWHALNLIFLFGGIFFGVILLTSTLISLVMNQLSTEQSPLVFQSFMVILMGALIPLLIAAMTSLYVKIEESK
jgi:hypothetical protein